MKPTLLCGALALLATLPLAAEDPIPPAFESGTAAHGESSEIDPFDPAIDAPKIVRVQVEWIEISHKDLTRLMIEDQSKTTDATALRMKLQEMADKGTAKIIETQIGNARSGEKSVTESISELIYPTEYEPGTLVPTDSDAPPSETTPSATTFLATAFETRNVGSTLELQPNLGSDGKMIDLMFVPELCWHSGWSTYFDGKDTLGNDIKVVLPRIYTLRLVSAITCISGQYHLAGILSPKDDHGNKDPERKLMVFVKCTTLAAVE